MIALQAGSFVLLGLGALGFIWVRLPASGLSLLDSPPSYQITAEFDNVGALKVGDPVAMDGVTVGKVRSISLDPTDYRALVTMSILLKYHRIATDSEASIDTVGLLGGQYVAIGPGRSRSYLKNGGRLQSTRSAFVLETEVNKLFGVLAGKNGD